MKTKLLKELTKEDLFRFFRHFDEKIAREERSTFDYVILGGAALVLLDIIPRSTTDLDIAKGNFKKLKEAGEDFGIEIQKVSQCTTVDFDNCEKHLVFDGQFLRVFSVSLKDLLKSKLERYFKQDPDDISGIISHLRLSYPEFRDIFGEMLADFVGNRSHLIMHARTAVDRDYPGDKDDFYRTFPLSS